MKRFFSVFAAVVFTVFSVFALAPVSRAEKSITFSMTDADGVSAGDSVTVTLSISGDYQVHGLNLSIEYDPSSMKLEGCDEGGYLEHIRSLGCICILDSESLASQGKIRLGIACPTSPASGSGEVIKMKFRINSGVTVNQQVVMIVHECVYMPIGDNTGTNVAFTTDNSIIKLKGGSAPEGGYNEGESGVGNNIPSSTDPAPANTGAGSTSAPTGSPYKTDSIASTPAPTDAAGNAVKETAAPGEATVTSDPVDVTDNSGENGEGSETTSPDSTDAAMVETTADPDSEGALESGAPVIEDSEKLTAAESSTDKASTDKKGVSTPVLIGAGAVAVLAVAAAVVYFVTRKK